MDPAYEAHDAALENSARLRAWIKKHLGKRADVCLDTPLGRGLWGTVFATSDPRFVLKVTMDPTEVPHAVRLKRRGLGTHPGVAFVKAAAMLPRERYVPGMHGWIRPGALIREALDVERALPKGVARALDKLPSCCAGVLTETISCTPDARRAGRTIASITQRLRKVPSARALAALIDAAVEKRVLLGDLHSGNVAWRCHDLTGYKVPKGGRWVVSDLGDGTGQRPVREVKVPTI